MYIELASTSNNITFHTIDSDADIEEMRKYEDYYLYEYTDDIRFLINNPQYPSVLNYVKTGLLTEEEMLQALNSK